MTALRLTGVVEALCSDNSWLLVLDVRNFELWGFPYFHLGEGRESVSDEFNVEASSSLAFLNKWSAGVGGSCHICFNYYV